MGLFRRLFERRSAKLAGYNPQDPRLVEFFQSGSDTPSGIFVDHTSALKHSAVYACIRNIAEDVAKLPLILYQRLPRGRRRVPEHRLYPVLHDEPNPKMASMAFRESLTSWVLRWGNGYAEIVRDRAGRPAELHLLQADRVRPQLDSAADRIVYEMWDGTVVQSRDILHVRALGSDELEGWSPIRMARESIGAAMAAERYGARFWSNNARGGGQFKIPGTPPPEQLEELRRNITNAYAGPENAFRPKLMYGGMEWAADESIPNDDAQFLETRQFGVEDVARWYRMPPHKIQHLARSTNNNIEHQGLEYVTDTLMPWLVRTEQEINRKMLTPQERQSGLFVEHLVTALLRGDMAARGEFYSKLFQVGAITPNDIMIAENIGPGGPEGDQRFVPVNMMPLVEDMEPEPELEPELEPEPEPEPEDEPEPDDRMLVRLTDTCADLLGRNLVKVMKLESDRMKSKQGEGFCEWMEHEFRIEHPKHVRARIGEFIDSAAKAIWPLVRGEWDTMPDATDLMQFTAAVAEEHVRLIDPSSNGDIEIRAGREAREIMDKLVTRIRERPCVSS